MTDKIAGWIDERTSRKRFLGRTGKVMAGVGFGLLAGAYRPDVAGANIYCCGGTQCGGCPTTLCTCPAGWSYTGSSWTCCWFNGQLYILIHCWSCSNGGSTCTCNQRTGNVCF